MYMKKVIVCKYLAQSGVEEGTENMIALQMLAGQHLLALIASLHLLENASYSLSALLFAFQLPAPVAEHHVPFIDRPGAGLVGSDPRGLLVLSVNGKG